MLDHRAAGTALLVYGVGTFTANALIAAPGGEYDTGGIVAFAADGHRALAFAAAYLGCAAALAVLPFLLGIRSHLAQPGRPGLGPGDRSRHHGRGGLVRVRRGRCRLDGGGRDREERRTAPRSPAWV